MVKRLIDFCGAVVLLATLAIPMLAIAAAILLTSGRPVLYWSERVGRHNKIFRMPKFRSMRSGTPQLATHLLVDSVNWITPLGGWLRKTSLDELPQLWCILVGSMSFVGPRPALFNQQDLIDARTARNVHVLRPGLTGWAQIRGRDELSVADKVAMDCEYVRCQSLWFDVSIIVLTIAAVITAKGVKQASELSGPAATNLRKAA